MTWKAADKDQLVNLLPGASSDTENGSPMKVLSSSPPPSSPILTSSDDEHMQVLTIEVPNSQEDIDRVTTNFMQEFDWLTACSTSQQSFTDFGATGLMGSVHGSSEDAMESEFDEERLAAEIFDWSVADPSSDGVNSDGFQLGEFWNSVKPLMGESGGGGVNSVDGSKLASEMVDLFGGCLM
jgi:hypothetical protein